MGLFRIRLLSRRYFSPWPSPIKREGNYVAGEGTMPSCLKAGA